MNIFKLHKGYRDFGVNYGLPVFHIDCGLGVNYNPLEVIRKLGNMGLGKENWVVIRNNPLGEKGIGVLVEGLKYVGARVEIECNGSDMCPGWFPKVDRWIVDWNEEGAFNYGALRARQDMLVYRGEDIEGFIERTKDLLPLKAVVVDEVVEVWEKVKNSSLRVYKR